MSRFLAMLLLGGLAFGQEPSGSPSLAAIEPNKSTPVSAAVNANNGAGVLPDLLPPVWGKTTLVGGTIRSLDFIRDKFVIGVFGGRDMVVLFDGRTQVYRDGLAASSRDLRGGERVYVDTALAGTDVFARTVRVLTQGLTGQTNGQLKSFDPGSGELVVRDVLAGEPAKFRLAPNAVVLRHGHTSSATELRPGSLVSLKFDPSGKGSGLVRELSILASPGETFVFAGQVSYLDLHTGLLVLVEPRDQKNHDIHFDPAATRVDDGLREGADVIVTTSFDGARYTASTIVVTPASSK